MSDTPKNPLEIEAPEKFIELEAAPEHELLTTAHDPMLSAPVAGGLSPSVSPSTTSTVIASVENDHLEDDIHLFDAIPSETHGTPAVTEESLVEPISETVPIPVISDDVHVSPYDDTLPSVPLNGMVSENPVFDPPPSSVVVENPQSAPTLHQEIPLGVVKIHKKWPIIVGMIALLVLVGIGLIWGFVLRDTSLGNVFSFTVTPAPQATNYVDETALHQQEHEKNVNLANQALNEQNPLYCQNITVTIEKLECEESVHALILSASGTIAECQSLTLTGVRDRCVQSLAQKEAITTENKSLCSQIVDSNQAISCREAVDGPILARLVESKSATPESCAQFEPSLQRTCMASIVEQDDTAIMASAVKSDTLEACQKLSTDDLRYACFDTILMKRALTNEDKASCDLIHDTDKKATCLAQVGARDDNTAFKSAITDKNLQTCTTIQNTTLRDRCHDAVTLLIVRDTRDATRCDTLISTGTIDACRRSALQ